MTSHQLPSSEDPGIPLSLPIESSSLLPVTPAPSDSHIDLPIALRKGKRSCTIHPITQFLSFEGLSPSYRSFALALSSAKEPKSLREALAHPEWRRAMVEEMEALTKNGTWELVTLPKGKHVVGCQWVYTYL